MSIEGSSIVEILTRTNEMLADMEFTTVNGELPEHTTIRTGLSSATWKKLYGGVQPEKTHIFETMLKQCRCPYCSVKTTRTHGNCRQCGGPL